MAHYKHKALQNGAEHQRFCQLMVDEGAKSYLEIGSYCGGSLWKAANVLPKGSLVVTVDKPAITPEPSEHHLLACVDNLRDVGYRVMMFLGDSRDAQIIEGVQDVAPFDVCFIDANH